MNKDQREIQRKLRILRHAEESGHVARTCRYFGIGRSSFYRWRQAYAERGEAGLINAPPIPKWHANRTPPEREEKVLDSAPGDGVRTPTFGQARVLIRTPQRAT